MIARRVVITGVGVVSSLGDSPERLHASLCAGWAGLRPVELFDTGGLACHLGGEVAGFDAKQYLGRRNLRPLDRTSQLVAAAAGLALDCSECTNEMRARAEVGLVLGTMFCSVRTISSFDRRAITAGPSYASPMDFANTVINAAAGQTAIWHNLRGVNSTIATGLTSGLQAIGYATELIRSGRSNAILAGGADELCYESFLGFERAGLLCGSGARKGDSPVPFDARRNGFALGEGAALLMLEDADSAESRGARVLGEIAGQAGAYDSSRCFDENKLVDSISRSIQLSLDDAGVAAGDIGCLSASANGSVVGDRSEAMAMGRVFNGHASSVPVTAVKSMMGEMMGASGALQTVSLLEAMKQQVLPGIKGLESMEDGFPLRGARPENQPIDAQFGLVNSVGFDGNCCSLIVRIN